MTATLTDVAQLAGVSLATASRAFKEPERLAASTRSRVLEAAAELRYQVPERATTFGVVVPDTANPVFASLIASIQEQAWPSRARMVLATTAEDPDREREVIRSLAASVSGLVLVSPRLPGEEINACVAGSPVVVVNADVAFCPSVCMAGEEGIQQAVEHLVALGHRHLVYVPGPPSSWANQQREQTVATAAAGAGLELTVVGAQSASVEGGLAAAAAVVASGATAVLAYNDLVALGVQAGARSLGRECPLDLSIIGIDDLNIAAVAQPGLTSIRVDIAQGGAQAFTLLTDLLTGKAVQARADRRPSQLIVRASTAPVWLTGGSR